MRLVWDERKNESNRVKHGLSFDEVASLFSGGRDYLEIFDEAHSGDEDRFLAIGPIARGVIVVVFTEPTDEILRIISARKATHRETELFIAYTKRRRP